MIPHAEGDHAQPPAYLIALDDPDRAVLETWSRRRKTAQPLSLRVHIILSCAEMEATNSGVARRLRDECLNETLFTSLHHARQVLEAWRIDYNSICPHSPLKGMTPTDFANRTTKIIQSEEPILPVATGPHNGHQSTTGLQL
jgi:transposase InsO family protein